MSYVRLKSLVIVGARAIPVELECVQSKRLPYLQILGVNASSAVNLRERVISSIESSGFRFPGRKITVRVHPDVGNLPIEGLDLPLAVAILGLTMQFPAAKLENILFSSALGLDGRLLSVGGRALLRKILSSNDYQGAILSWEDSDLLPNNKFGGGFSTLPQVIEHLRSDQKMGIRKERAADLMIEPPFPIEFASWNDLDRSFLEIAAAGGHASLLLNSEKSSSLAFAHSLLSLFPAASSEEREEITSLHSEFSFSSPASRPFISFTKESVKNLHRAGRTRLPAYPFFALAQHGIAFLDESCWKGGVHQQFESLKEDPPPTKEDGKEIFTSYSSQNLILVAQAPLCACRWKGSSVRSCLCSSVERKKHFKSILQSFGAPFDLVLRLDRSEVFSPSIGIARTWKESRKRIETARELALCRQGKRNAELELGEVHEVIEWTKEARKALSTVRSEGGWSERAIARLALTIRDLQGGGIVQESDVLCARHYGLSGFSELGKEGRMF